MVSDQAAMRRPTADATDTVIPFSPNVATSVSDSADPLDSAGQTILGMLSRAAAMAEEKIRHALDAAHKLSHQLQAAEDRITDLEIDLRHYYERADRAEKWLHQISLEIEERFFGSANSHHPSATPRKTSPEDYAPRRR